MNRCLRTASTPTARSGESDHVAISSRTWVTTSCSAMVSAGRWDRALATRDCQCFWQSLGPGLSAGRRMSRSANFVKTGQLVYHHFACAQERTPLRHSTHAAFSAWSERCGATGVDIINRHSWSESRFRRRHARGASSASSNDSVSVGSTTIRPGAGAATGIATGPCEPTGGAVARASVARRTASTAVIGRPATSTGRQK